MAKANKNSTTTANKNAKVNWGVLRDAKHADILETIQAWKSIRNQMAIDAMQKKGETEALRADYKGFLVDKQWITLDKAKQEEYNLAENAIMVRYKELAKQRKAATKEIYKKIGLDKALYTSYTAYIAAESAEEEREAYITEVDAFLRLGLKVPFGDKGRKFAATKLVEGIGKKMNGVSAAYKSDVDAQPYKEAAFLDAVMANLRSILQEVGVIGKNPIEKPKSDKDSEAKSKSKIKSENENAIPEGRVTLPTPIKTPDEFPEATTEIKKPSRNRGVKSQKGNGKAKQNSKTESKKETVAA